MAWRVPEISTGISGQTTITYALPWAELQEFVYLNGTKLVRGVDYTDERSSENLALGEVDTIELTTPIASDSDILELAVYVDPAGPQIEALLTDILTAVAGSWFWDKADGTMKMLDVNGIDRFAFTVSDSAESASRERRQDLEV